MVKKLLCSAAVVGGMLVSGCQQVYVRSDGRLATPATELQRELDEQRCQNEANQTYFITTVGYGALAGGIASGQQGSNCMTRLGYVQVPKEKAAEMQRRLRETYDERKATRIRD
ncbi:MAG: hypothetical protein ACRC2U_21025 [Aeromonas sp.]